MNSINAIKRQTNLALGSLPMYRVVLYALSALLATSFGLSAIGQLAFSPLELAVSSGLFIGLSYATNRLLGWLYKAPLNSESVFITALILTLIVEPPSTMHEALVIVLVAVIAQASKYVIAYRQRHIFNPAALAVAVIALLGIGQTSWWVGTSVLLPLVSVLGLIVLMRVRRLQMFMIFAVVALAELLYYGLMGHRATGTVIAEAFTSGPLVFFGAIMLTEPFTSPSRRRYVLAYSALAGLLFAGRFEFGPVYATPAIALVVANIFAFTINAKGNHLLILQSIKRYGTDCYQLVFSPQRPLAHIAGQYLEWTLPHRHHDQRGVRRFFTIASSPTEPTVAIGVKVSAAPSSFKKALLSMKPGDTIRASNLGGDFVLPRKESNQPLVFIAGGIGVTPFRSMIAYAIDAKLQQPITLLYLVAKPEDVMYTDIFNAARTAGITVIYILTSDQKPANWLGEHSKFSAGLLRKHVPKPKEAIYYVSGPSGMVLYCTHVLSELGIKQRDIKRDYFSGY